MTYEYVDPSKWLTSNQNYFSYIILARHGCTDIVYLFLFSMFDEQYLFLQGKGVYWSIGSNAIYRHSRILKTRVNFSYYNGPIGWYVWQQ
jgi:hypothetical protein